MWQSISSCALLLLLLSGCAGTSRNEYVVTAPAGFHGFPNPAHHGALWAEASYVHDYHEVLDSDLVEQGMLPIRLRIGLRGEVPGAPRLTAETFDPHLYLQDGTVLEWAPPGSWTPGRRSTARIVAEQSLRLSLLESWSDAKEGTFLFFRIPDTVRLVEFHALSSNDRGHREVDLRHSLLSFAVLTDSGTQRIFVGMN